MTGLAGLPPDAGLAAALALRPGLGDRVERMVAELWACGVPPRVLELCRVRMATLLGRDPATIVPTQRDGRPVCDAATLGDLRHWPTSERFDAADRACLALAEQWLLDVHGVEDDQVHAVRDAIGDAGATGLAVGLALFEGFDRARLALGLSGPDPRGATP